MVARQVLAQKLIVSANTIDVPPTMSAGSAVGLDKSVQDDRKDALATASPGCARGLRAVLRPHAVIGPIIATTTHALTTKPPVDSLTLRN